MVVMAPQLRAMPRSAQAWTMRSASSRVWHMGFSVKMPLAPDSAALVVRKARPLVLVATATISSFSFAIISTPSV